MKRQYNPYRGLKGGHVPLLLCPKTLYPSATLREFPLAGTPNACYKGRENNEESCLYKYNNSRKYDNPRRECFLWRPCQGKLAGDSLTEGLPPSGLYSLPRVV